MAAMEDQEVYEPQAALTPIEEPQRRRSTLLTGEARASLYLGDLGLGDSCQRRAGSLVPWHAHALAVSHLMWGHGGRRRRPLRGDASVQALRCRCPLLRPSMLNPAGHVCRSLPLHPGQRVLRAAGVLRVRCVTQSPSVLPLLSARGAADCSCCLQNRAACGAQCSRGSHRMAPHRVLQRQPGRSLLHEGT